MGWLKDFMNTPEERHSFIIGVFEALCPWPARYCLRRKQLDQLRGEYHYYSAGRALGFIALGALIIGAVKILA